MDMTVLTDACFCELCGHEFYTAWVLGDKHFPIDCPKCHVKAAMRVPDEEGDFESPWDEFEDDS